MNYRQIKNLKMVVHDMLRDIPDTRNSDIALTIAIWRKYFPQRIESFNGDEFIRLRDLYDLPREDNVKRVRAFWQNDKRLFLPTQWPVARARGFNEDEWRVALGYPTVATTGTPTPSWTPPSETNQGKLL